MKTIDICAVRTDKKTRKSWICPSGVLGTVEELAREYYLQERQFSNCLIDSACVYGGLSWVLFHDILFHDNLDSKQPLCSQFLNTPNRFYDKHKTTIEQRLVEYSDDPQGVFDEKMNHFCIHPFFCDPKSKIDKYHGDWLMRNRSALRDFACMSIEYDQASLIREIMIKSYKGRSKGWPDLVVWSSSTILFAEVKSTDKLSKEQILWIEEHENQFPIELVQITKK